jgi:uncharacterized membrane protein YtjA (UPF0391 family)
MALRPTIASDAGNGCGIDGVSFKAERGSAMLYYALVFFIVAIVAAIFGFGGIAAGAASIAQVLFFIFLVLFIASLIAGLLRRGGP